jgi:hypothetical protein
MGNGKTFVDTVNGKWENILEKSCGYSYGKTLLLPYESSNAIVQFSNYCLITIQLHS